MYSLKEITSSDLYFKRITELDSGNENIDLQVGVTGDSNPISIASQQAGWNPGLRLIISRTDSL